MRDACIQFYGFLSSHKSSYGSDCHIFDLACGPVQVQKLQQQSMVEFVFFHQFCGVRFIFVN